MTIAYAALQTFATGVAGIIIVMVLAPAFGDAAIFWALLVISVAIFIGRIRHP